MPITVDIIVPVAGHSAEYCHNVCYEPRNAFLISVDSSAGTFSRVNVD